MKKRGICKTFKYQRLQQKYQRRWKFLGIFLWLFWHKACSIVGRNKKCAQKYLLIYIYGYGNQKEVLIYGY